MPTEIAASSLTASSPLCQQAERDKLVTSLASHDFLNRIIVGEVGKPHTPRRKATLLDLAIARDLHVSASWIPFEPLRQIWHPRTVLDIWQRHVRRKARSPVMSSR